MSDIDIKVGKELPFEQLLALYDSVNWAAYTNEQNRNKLETAVRNSTYVVSAWTDGELIGFARGMSDDVSIFYLQDILVRPDFQGKGIGRMLLNNCLERFSHVRTKMLLTDDEEKQLKFYESLGFKNTRHLQKIVMNAFVQMEGIKLE
jgi:ribosomal protein S18 acetylase RimI-like enzyme